MWNNTVSFYIDDASLRLLVNKGQRIKSWSEVKLETGLIKDSIVIDEAAVAAKIKHLIQSQAVKEKKVRLISSGLHCLTRPITLPEMPNSMISEAVSREARRVLPVPIDQLYLSWRSIAYSHGKIQVFIVAIPRQMADSLVKTLYAAGLKPSFMTIKPVTLTRLIPISTAILLDLQPAEFDIIILSDGIAQPIRTVSFPEKDFSEEKKLEMIINELDRTIKFFDTNNTEKPLGKGVPLYVSGDLLIRPELHDRLSAAIDHPVRVLTTALKLPEQLEFHRFEANLAAAVKVPTTAKKDIFPGAAINVLPTPYRPKPVSMGRIIAIPAVAVAAGLIIFSYAITQSNAERISSLQSQLDATNQIINQKNTQKIEIKKSLDALEKQAAESQAACDNIKTAVDSLTNSQEQVNGDLITTLENLGSTITLTGISVASDALVLTGETPNENDIYTYAQAILSYATKMDGSHRYVETVVSSLSVKTETTAPLETESQESVDLPASSQSAIDFVLTFKREGYTR